MCHALHDPAFFRFLTLIDAQLAAEARDRRCPECAGPLHVADFHLKPRGCLASVREEYSSRLSFTCGRCDVRTTPASVRFLGRRVYVAVMLMLASPPAGSARRHASMSRKLSRKVSCAKIMTSNCSRQVKLLTL